MVDVHSFLHHHHHCRHDHCHHNSPPTTHHHLATSPSPLLRDVGSSMNTSGCAEWTAAAPAPPHSKGMWVDTYSIHGGIGGGNTQGGTQQVGGPSSASQKWAMTFVVALFFSSLSPATSNTPLTISNPTQRPAITPSLP